MNAAFARLSRCYCFQERSSEHHTERLRMVS
uniref:Uncharacterized protein n=1 Tax=Anguilla anguilla TaxID=7936 RepID=A0A0E9PQA9_ANGAN